ncbi:FAD-dependent monooxygenase [Sphingorhabdus arenilitoris]|uniref:FAD-dependent monooxygenase n=1 Tax=Sphingorhabdus arenilitoris TaxID=1490041 RepID=A0ABV8RIT2_9SPHN
MKIAIIGAGIGGLTAAIALRRAGHEVEIFEQAGEIAPMGAALSIWPNALAALDEIGLGEPLREIAQPFNDAGVADWRGRDINRFAVSDVADGQRACLPTRTQLQKLLLDHLGDIPLHLGCHLVRQVESNDAVTLVFENRTEASFDMLVAADGIWSKTALCVEDNKPAYAGYGGILAISGSVPGHPSAMRCTEYWGKGERIGIFDLNDDRKYWFYMKTGCRDEEARSLTTAILAKNIQGWPKEIAATVQATDDADLIPFVIHAKRKPSRLAQGRILLVGDAGHAMEPNMGQGACQAIEDGVTLGALSRRTEDAIALGEAYQQQRLSRVREFVAMSAQGSIAAHKLPHMLITPTHAVMRAIFPALAKRQIGKLFQWHSPA